MNRQDETILAAHRRSERDKYQQEHDNKRYREVALAQAVVVATAVNGVDIPRLAKDFYKFLQGGE